MKASRRQFPLLAASALAATFILTSCTPGAEDPSATEKDTLTVAWSAITPQLDPNIYSGPATLYTVGAFCSTLIEYDGSDGGDRVLGLTDLKPGLAESWSLADDGTSYVLKLKEGVLSSAGNELTADDVVWSFQRILVDPSGLGAGLMLPAANADMDNPMTKIDDYTVQYNLKAPSAVALAVLAYPVVCVHDSVAAQEHATDDDPWAHEWLATNTASYGPYMVEMLVPDEQVRFTENPNYWGEKPEFSNIIIRAVPEASTRVQLLAAGEIDMITDVPASQVQSLRDNAEVRVEEQPDSNRHLIQLNTKSENLQDPQVRRALSMAIDRNALVESVYRGTAVPAVTPLSSVFSPADSPNVEYDPDAARQMLEDAGAPDDLTIQLTINLARPGPYAEDIAKLVQADWAKIGVQTEIVAIPAAADFQTAVASGALEAWLYTERPAHADPGYAMYLYLHSTSSLNTTSYDNPSLDQLIEQILATDPADPTRIDLVAEAVDILADDEPSIYFAEVSDVKAMRAELAGYVSYPSGATNWTELHWEN